MECVIDVELGELRCCSAAIAPCPSNRFGRRNGFRYGGMGRLSIVLPSVDVVEDGIDVIFVTSRFEATRGLFWVGPRHFEPQSDAEEDTRAGTPSPNFRTTSAGGHMSPTDQMHQTSLHGGSSVEWGSNLVPFSPEIETLPPGRSDLIETLEK
ncbi:hypothetical protein AVEN_29626-1 [Araneus ventricosus]|uniref:Uncharacterized protein n=1 Tax=Araneus ventricosus TaxID=182803 RepID=A0A4Y2VC21_ARAVE|nr:hypothetical protein AVEN_29626-1 [Araneus ventricosus]